jgi:hypothetical protein
VRVMRHGGTPGMEDRDKPDARAEPLGIGGDPEHGLRRGLEQDAVDRGLILVGDTGNAGGQRVHHMEIGHGQKLGLTLGQPFPCRRALTLGAMPVAAAIIGDGCVPAPFILAARNMAAERGGTAALDGTHDFQLREADVAAIGLTPSGTVIAENIRDLQHWPGHSGGLSGLTLLRPFPLPAERARDARDPARGNARVARRRVELVVAQNRLD